MKKTIPAVFAAAMLIGCAPDKEENIETAVSVMFADNVLLGTTAGDEVCGGRYLYDDSGDIVGYLRNDLRVAYLDSGNTEIGEDIGGCRMDGVDICRLSYTTSTWRDPLPVSDTDSFILVPPPSTTMKICEQKR